MMQHCEPQLCRGAIWKYMHAQKELLQCFVLLQAASQRLGCLNGAQVPGVAGRISASSCACVLGTFTRMASASFALATLARTLHVKSLATQ